MGQPDFNILYEAILQVKEDTGKLVANQNSHEKRLDRVEVSHSKLKNDFNSHKYKLLTIGGLLGGLFGGLTTWFYKYFGGH